jgi:hypothetical protein
VAVVIEIGGTKPLVGPATDGKEAAGNAQAAAAVAFEKLDFVFGPTVGRN